MFCESCGAKLPEGSKFCASCGAKNEGSSPAKNVSEQARPPQASYNAPPQAGAYRPPTSPPPPPPQGQGRPQGAYQGQPGQARPQGQPGQMPPGQGRPQPPVQQQAGMRNLNAPLKVGQYIGMFFLMMIPIAGFILLLVWAFGSDTNINKKNFARAQLILMLIGIGIGIVISIIIGSMTASLFRSLDLLSLLL